MIITKVGDKQCRCRLPKNERRLFNKRLACNKRGLNIDKCSLSSWGQRMKFDGTGFLSFYSNTMVQSQQYTEFQLTTLKKKLFPELLQSSSLILTVQVTNLINKIRIQEKFTQNSIRPLNVCNGKNFSSLDYHKMKMVT